MKLRPERIEDVPVPELSGLALVTRANGPPQLLAIGDRRSVLARAVLTDAPLDWTVVDLDQHGLTGSRGQLEGVAGAGDGTILVLSEGPPLVWAFDVAGDDAKRIPLVAGRQGVLRDVFADASSAGEGLLPLRDGRLLVAQEKDPALLIELGPRGARPAGVDAQSFVTTGAGWTPSDASLHALAAWGVGDVDDISDLALSAGALYCLSDKSRRVVVIDLPLDPDADRAVAAHGWDLRVPKRDGEPDGKPEGLVVTDDGTLIVGLDTESPSANLCWYQP
jgi:uncharacterized protein YjiK